MRRLALLLPIALGSCSKPSAREVRRPDVFLFVVDTKPTLLALGEDPGETHDLCEERPEDVERLRKKLAAWMQACPTRSSLHRKKGAKELGDMKKLGYAGEDE